LPKNSFTRILYIASPLGAFMTPPVVLMVPNTILTQAMRAALEQAHAAEFGVGHEHGFDDAALKADAIYLCDLESLLHNRVVFQRTHKFPGVHGCLVAYAVPTPPQRTGVVPPTDLLSAKITHEYIFKHPV
jgi:hypothetical protein